MISARRMLSEVIPSYASLFYRSLQRRFGNGSRDFRLAVEAGFDQQAPLIHAGPFAGMRYTFESRGSALLPKLIGSYESELHTVIELCLTNDYSRVIDVGCAEGYYAVGFAVRKKSTVIFAFDIDPQAREACMRLGELNDCSDRIFISGKATFGSLTSILEFNSLIIMDCEGAEMELLDPKRLPELLNCDILVELHPGIVKSVDEVIFSRFKKTHEIEVIKLQPRDYRCYPRIAKLHPDKQFIFVDEFRADWGLWAFIKRG